MSTASKVWRALSAMSLGFTVASLLDMPLASINLFEGTNVSMLLNALYLLLELNRYR